MNLRTNYPTTPKELLASFWRNRQLILQMTKREVLGRYKGSVMGLAWSFFNPVLMLVVYTFFFSVIFKARWDMPEGGSKTSFAIVLFVGMIVHGVFAEVVNRAPTLILSNVNYVKKIVFPLEILPWVNLGSALFHAVIGLSVLLATQLLTNHTLPWTAIFFPIILLPLVFCALGLGWFLASLGVYARDVGQVTGVFTTVLMFLSPVFYPLSALPPRYQFWLKINPLTIIIEESRNSLIFGVTPNWVAWFAATAGACTLAWLGFWWFQRTRKGFADVL